MELRKGNTFFTRDRSFYSQLGRLLPFIVLQNLIVCLIGLVGNILIGNYGVNAEYAIIGVGLCNQVQFLLQMVIGGVGEGMAVLTSQYWGAKRAEPIRDIVSIAMRYAVVTGLIFTAVALIFPSQLLGLFTSEQNAIAEGVKYLRIIAYSYVFFCAGNVLIIANRSVENVFIGMFTSLAALVVNVILTYALIFGKLGLPELGVIGAAIATLISRILEFGIVAAYTVLKDEKLNLKIKTFLLTSRELSKDYFKVALPVILSGTSWGLAMLLQTVILGRIDAQGTAIAANSIANTLFQVLTVVIYGIASASAIIIAKAVGRDDLDNLRPYVRTLQAIFIATGLLTSLALFAAKGPILSFYKIDAAAYAMTDSFINVLCITVIGTAYQCACLAGIVRGGGNTKFVFYNDLIFMWLIVLPVSALAAYVFHWNPIIVFFCLKSDQLTKCTVAAVYVNSYRWIKKVAREQIA